MRWKRYTAYKDSGVEWLGEVPEHWDVLPIKRLKGHSASLVQTGPFGAQLHANDYVDDGEVPLILIRHLQDSRISDDAIPLITQEKADSLCMYRVEKNDIVFSRVGTVGRSALVTDKEDGWLISGQMLRIRLGSSRLVPRYLMYYLEAPSTLVYFNLMAIGSTRESINTTILRNIPVAVPPRSEQEGLLRFLDDKTNSIDCLSANKKHQLELLEEKRTALITQAVTKGLDPNVKMKDSGVAWLRAIPEHWELIRLKYCVSEKNNLGYLEDSMLVELEDIQPWTGRVEPKQVEVASGRIFSPGDVLFSKLRPYLAKAFLAKEAGICSGELLVLEPKLFRPRYLLLLLLTKGFIDTVDSSTYGAKMPRASWEFIGNMVVPLPPAHEQKRICQSIDHKTKRIDALREKIQQSIELLQEYRSALISAAVTGQIDVREEVV